jgi:hypothetical protein
MAIVTEVYKEIAEGVKLNRTYSDSGVKIKKVGTEEVYNEAVDVEGASFTYEETDQPVDTIEEEETN